MIVHDFLRHACVSEIRQAWIDSGEVSRPPIVWIAEHMPVALVDAAHNYPSPVANAWLLNDHGVERRDPQEYVRFMTVHSGYHWARGRPPRGIFSNTGSHPIGLAGFAPIVDTDLVALHFIWGGLWGRGSHYRYDSFANTLVCVADIWVS
ncbi:hypothetical protein IV454_07690 [Massilia antarctica]|uniref:Uncharacterized protein n=1 Tax=Massilia antarctica TaxID=2765360 RepID=A0AA48WEW1_9BURK|nr:hypothetical protein [Massilia antarctica]QPI51390.1 hypothetical protein IV454_07690 [Massilia antarctica]